MLHPTAFPKGEAVQPLAAPPLKSSLSSTEPGARDCAPGCEGSVSKARPTAVTPGASRMPTTLLEQDTIGAFASFSCADQVVRDDSAGSSWMKSCERLASLSRRPFDARQPGPVRRLSTSENVVFSIGYTHVCRGTYYAQLPLP